MGVLYLIEYRANLVDQWRQVTGIMGTRTIGKEALIAMLSCRFLGASLQHRQVDEEYCTVAEYSAIELVVGFPGNVGRTEQPRASAYLGKAVQ